MRVRLHRSSAPARPAAPPAPRLRVVEQAPVDPRPAEEDPFADERRLRDAGGPDDQATYHCTCGYVFEADVTTSVACPHCGTGQAW